MTIPTLITARFEMRPLQHGDAAALFATLSDEAQCRYLMRPAFDNEDELWSWLADAGWPGLTWIAVDAQKAVVGRFVAVPRDPAGTGAKTGANPGAETGAETGGAVFEIGYITVAERQGEGIAAECVAALIGHLITDGARKLTAEVDARNAPSTRLLEKLGFTREATLREHDATHIGLCDVCWYGLLAREWNTQKAVKH